MDDQILTIERCSNGAIVRKRVEQNMAITAEDTLVFETNASLLAYFEKWWDVSAVSEGLSESNDAG